MDKKRVEKIKRESLRGTTLSCLYQKNDGTSARRTIQLQPPEKPHDWFDEDVYVYGRDVEKGT